MMKELIRNKRRRVVITGIGPIASPGIGKESLWRGVYKQKTGLQLVTSNFKEINLTEFYLHKIRDFDISSFGLSISNLKHINAWKQGRENYDLNLLLAATKLALDDSRINYHRQDKALGLIVAHENPCLEQLLSELFNGAYNLCERQPAQKKEFFYNLFSETVRTAYETQPFMFLFHIAQMFNIHNFSMYTNHACASGLYALEMASDMIEIGKALQVVVVAGDCPGIFKFLWFKMINMYEPDGKIKPFSRNAKGFVLGEGATGIVLEDYESAKKRKAKIYAEYLGGAFQLEGWKVTAPNIAENYLQNVIKNALKKTSLKKEDVDLICAHGVGMRASDYYEAKSIVGVFGAATQVPITALKPYIGHNLGGCTLIELAILLLSMERKYILPIMNTNNSDIDFKLNFVTKGQERQLKIVLKICCAFAGYNAAVILKKL